MSWRQRAACHGDWDLFHSPERERADVARDRIALAKAICAGCPVRWECLDDAVRNDDQWGIYGGLTPEERGARTSNGQHRSQRQRPRTPTPETLLVQIEAGATTAWLAEHYGMDRRAVRDAIRKAQRQSAGAA